MKLSVFFIVTIFVSCSHESKDVPFSSLIENIPKLELEQFETKRFDDFEILLLKELTASSAKQSKFVRINHNNFASEKHLTVLRDSSSYASDLKSNFGEVDQEILRTYAHEALNKFKGVMREVDTSELIFSLVNGIPCYRTYFEANAYGFPRRKSYWIRYFKTTKGYYSMISWTTLLNQSKFESEVTLMGLSFKPTFGM